MKVLTRQHYFFKVIFTLFSLRILILYLNLKTCPPTSSTIHSISITEEEVYNALISLDSAKAMALMELALQSYSTVLILWLNHFATYIFIHHNCCLPLEWRIHCITPIFKAGNKIVLPTTDPYLYFALYSRYLNILRINAKITSSIFDHISTWFMKVHSLLYNNFSSSSHISMSMEHKQMLFTLIFLKISIEFLITFYS